MSADLNVRELAELVGVHPETVRRLARADRLPGAYKIGRQWRFAREAVDRLRGEVGRSAYRPGAALLGTLEVEGNGNAAQR